MNDLTKEELVDILAALYYSSNCPGLFIGDLKNKIRSLIERYCDCIGEDEFTDTIIKCVKCSKIKGYAYE